MSKFKLNLNEFTREMAASELAKRLSNLWGENTERWDVASTGCVANITPIFGYLWLMVAAHTNQNKTIYVTKLPSKGGSCGTVDILESGGLSFPTDAEAIVEQCKKELGVICQPTNDLAPVDKVLMDVRRATNLITNFPLVYASILSKRIAIGCTHCIVDVKIGKDSKMLSGCLDEKLLKLVTTNFVEDNKQKLVLTNSEILKQFQLILSKMIGGTDTQLPALKDKTWIEQNCDEQLMQLKKIYWLLTNSTMPQCRAIGRQLILIHIECLISQKDDLLTQDNEYKKLYAEVLPAICGVSDCNWENLRTQWENLKKKLPKLGRFTVEKYLEDIDCKYSELEKSYGGEDGNDLRIISFGLYPYKLQAINRVVIQQMDAYALDKMFEWLCGEETYDPEVGIWLHKLPGEILEECDDGNVNEVGGNGKNFLEICNKYQHPVISIFYRPSRNPESEVMAKVRQFLCKVEVEQVRD